MIEVTVCELGRSARLTEMCSIQSYKPLKTEKFLWLLSEMQQREGQRIFSSRQVARGEQKNAGREGQSGRKPGIS